MPKQKTASEPSSKRYLCFILIPKEGMHNCTRSAKITKYFLLLNILLDNLLFTFTVFKLNLDICLKVL